jgi:ribose transport system substrate-binding protein
MRSTMSGKTARVWVGLAGALALTVPAGIAYRMQARQAPAVPAIAFIPQTAGAMLWEVEYAGATEAAEKRKYRLFWNAPTSESDMAGQVSLIDKAARGQYQGLILAPNHTLGIRAPLHRALEAGLPVVIVGSQLDIPAGDRLAYIVNDDEKMGELAAAEVAKQIHGKGTILLVGLARFTPGVPRRLRGAERYLASQFPEIHIVSRVGGANSVPRAEALTHGVLDSHPGLSAVLSFTSVATRGVHAALKSRSLQGTVRLVGCEQDSDLMSYVRSGDIAAIVAENTYRMGDEAVGLIADSLAGRPLRAQSVIPPLLITKQNFDSAEAKLVTSLPR